MIDATFQVSRIDTIDPSANHELRVFFNIAVPRTRIDWARYRDSA